MSKKLFNTAELSACVQAQAHAQRVFLCIGHFYELIHL